MNERQPCIRITALLLSLISLSPQLSQAATKSTITISRQHCVFASDCSDGIACNGAEFCVNNQCRAGASISCDDGLFCTGEETCDDTLDCVTTGYPCTENQYCNEQTDRCEEAAACCFFEDICFDNVFSNDCKAIDGRFLGEGLTCYDDLDSDGYFGCDDYCPRDTNKSQPGICGCGVSDDDTDEDGKADCNDACPNTPIGLMVDQQGCTIQYGACCFSNHNCWDDTTPNHCQFIHGRYQGNGLSCNEDIDEDGYNGCDDECPMDYDKSTPGVCGCGVSDVDTDEDNTADCLDLCPWDKHKSKPGICGCSISDEDVDADGVADCFDQCPDSSQNIPVDQQGCSFRGACCFNVGICIENTLINECITVGGRYQGHQSDCGSSCNFINNGDMNGNGFVDLNDLLFWIDCMTESVDNELFEGCTPFDFDHNFKVDLADFAEFQIGFTGIDCVTDRDCDDGNNCTHDSCNSTNHCIHILSDEDNDNDGILNCTDQCPDTPAVILVDDHGCPTGPLNWASSRVLSWYQIPPDLYHFSENKILAIANVQWDTNALIDDFLANIVSTLNEIPLGVETTVIESDDVYEFGPNSTMNRTIRIDEFSIDTNDGTATWTFDYTIVDTVDVPGLIFEVSSTRRNGTMTGEISDSRTHITFTTLNAKQTDCNPICATYDLPSNAFGTVTWTLVP